MTNNNENEAIGMIEPCVEVTRNERLSADVEVNGSGPVALVWVDGKGAGKVCLTYHNNRLVDVTIHNCTVTKKTHKDSAGNHTVIMRVKGDF